MRVRYQVLQLTTASSTLVVSTDAVAVVADVLGANLLSAVAVVGVGFVAAATGGSWWCWCSALLWLLSIVLCVTVCLVV